jgi:hypothetical protein
MSIWGRVFSMKNYALVRPNTARYGDHAEHKSNYRKEHRCETLDETFCEAMNTESWEWLSSQPEQEANELTELQEMCSQI